MVKKILITGGIGSGKSTISNILAKLGYSVFDADIFAREVLFYPEIESNIKNIFGSHVFLEHGSLDRNLVRKMVLEDFSLKKMLEDVLHPAIEEELNKKSVLLNNISKNSWLFYEASLVLENRKKSLFDACVVVTAKHEFKLSRLIQSRNLTEEEVNKIMASQMTDEEKKLHADYIIENSNDHAHLEHEVFRLVQLLYKKFSIEN